LQRVLHKSRPGGLLEKLNEQNSYQDLRQEHREEERPLLYERYERCRTEEQACEK
jgi:hypothetical protein